MGQHTPYQAQEDDPHGTIEPTFPPLQGQGIDPDTFRRVWERVMPDQSRSPLSVDPPGPEASVPARPSPRPENRAETGAETGAAASLSLPSPPAPSPPAPSPLAPSQPVPPPGPRRGRATSPAPCLGRPARPLHRTAGGADGPGPGGGRRRARPGQPGHRLRPADTGRPGRRPPARPPPAVAAYFLITGRRYQPPRPTPALSPPSPCPAATVPVGTALGADQPAGGPGQPATPASGPSSPAWPGRGPSTPPPSGPCWSDVTP